MMPPNDYPDWIENVNVGPAHDGAVNIFGMHICRHIVCQLLVKGNSWYCASFHNACRYIDVPIFVMENKFDKLQHLVYDTYNINELPCNPNCIVHILQNR